MTFRVPAAAPVSPPNPAVAVPRTFGTPDAAAVRAPKLAVALWPAEQGARAQQAADPVAALKARFARPTFVPNPSGNPPTPAKIALGKRIFEDAELSATGTIACATCHDPKLGFGDGEPKGKGVTNRRLARHTPSLWNVAWSPLLFWDGRADSLEHQAQGPPQNAKEMFDGSGDAWRLLVERVRGKEDYRQRFLEAFGYRPW